MVEKYFKSEGFEVIGLNKDDFDFRDFTRLDYEISKFLRINQKTYIINCAGILNNGKNIQEFAEINITLPHILAHICKRNNIKLITISTNCVYASIGPHSLNDVPDAKDFYGQSKYFGEVIDNHNLTIRTSIIGPELNQEGIGLFNWFVNKSESPVEGYKYAFWNGVTTLELAKFIHQKVILGEEEITGLIHYHSENTLSKYELLKQINNIFELNKEVKPVDKSAHSSILDGEYIGKYQAKNIILQLEELKSFMNAEYSDKRGD